MTENINQNKANLQQKTPRKEFINFTLNTSNCNKTDIYIGQNAGSKLSEDIKNAKHTLLIISPYVSDDKIDEILEITTPNNGKAYQPKVSFIFADEDNIENNTKLLNSLKKLLIINKNGSPSYANPNLDIKCLQKYNHKDEFKFIHAKIYIIDEEIVYLGSLNYTRSGLQNNIESSIRLHSTELAKEITNYTNDFFTQDSNMNYINCFKDYKDKKSLINMIYYPTNNASQSLLNAKKNNLTTIYPTQNNQKHITQPFTKLLIKQGLIMMALLCACLSFIIYKYITLPKKLYNKTMPLYILDKKMSYLLNNYGFIFYSIAILILLMFYMRYLYNKLIKYQKN